MPYDRSTSNLFNPLFAWADLGMRAAEMTVASSQTLGDAFDRMTRAGASVDASEAGAASDAVPEVPRPALPSTLGQLGNLQRTFFELAAQGWVRWMSALGTFASLPAGVGLARTVSSPVNPLEAVRGSLRPAGWGEKPATERQTGSLTYPAQRGQQDATSDMQHALAAGEAKPRRKAAAKRKGARRTARKSA
jgi:uncharacterized lipoprotein NlpE involved in copper resistance